MKKFKAESERLLDLMINSIYTNKEIFLRELISNASDAIDKRHFLSLTDADAKADYAIRLETDKDNRKLTVSDNGIGMGKEELEANLGTIAASGTGKFKTENETAENLIGQFGVGFYSAFMVANKVTVYSKKYGDDKGWKWTSTGADGYDIAPFDVPDVGTKIELNLRDDDEDCKYSEFLSEYKIKELITSYSDYIRYPIKMEVTKSKKDGENYVDYTEEDTLNTMTPIWKKQKGKVKKEEYEAFYRSKFRDYRAPSYVFSANIEGAVTYTALLFVPEKAPYDYYSREYQKGLKLYSNGVLIMDSCADILPDCFGFLKGIIDSPDVSLNISREVLQKDRQLRNIAESLEKKIVSELKKLMKKDFELYSKIFEEYGQGIKFGAYDRYGERKDLLKDLLLFYSSEEKKLVSLDSYVERMKEGQPYIYYACGTDRAALELLPAVKIIRAKGYEVLFLIENVDEFVLKVLENHKDKKFKNVSSADASPEDESEKEVKEENKDLISAIKEALDGKVDDVTVKPGLADYPARVSSRGEVSLEMEKVLNAMPGEREKIKAQRVLEINADHAVFAKLTRALNADKDSIKDYAVVLYNQALMNEGLPADDVYAYAEAVNRLMR